MTYRQTPPLLVKRRLGLCALLLCPFWPALANHSVPYLHLVELLWLGKRGPDLELAIAMEVTLPPQRVAARPERIRWQLSVDGHAWGAYSGPVTARSCRPSAMGYHLLQGFWFTPEQAGGDTVGTLARTHGPYHLTLDLWLADGSHYALEERGERLLIRK